MKKHLLIFLLVAFTGSATISAYADNNPESKQVQVSAIKDKLSKNPEIKLNDEEIQCLVDRVKEIRGMDKKELSKDEKRALRSEVKDIKQILKEQDYVVYISLTALLLILLLIILL
jgi:predicted GTPase